ncbi:hypothetical protein [Ruminiclostridium cellulolyticum]|uniref:hypothetical protein n=1 Tax=Ruminiclostridium cellulolyticum TaxID=1521 RepID=UPI0003109DB2|nr:hypothetical protein [Ruminiclostridium cellulolyticum]
MNSFIGWIGMGSFYKDSHADMEVYNDYNSELVNLFRCIKYHCGEQQAKRVAIFIKF